MLPTTETIKERLEKIRTNPNAIQRYALDLLSEASNNEYTISDPSNPFIFLLETSAVLASSSMDESRSRARELYPVLASKSEDLYRHMSDVDFLNIFSTPGRITMSLIFKVHDIFNLAVKVPDQTYKKITIPKNSIFSISEYNFGIYYPIDLRVTLQKELQIVYDTFSPSPIKTLKDDKIDFNYFTYRNNQFVNIDLPMDQYTLTSHRSPLTVNIGFNQTYNYSDYYYYCRVFTKRKGMWIELLTTHSKEVFDFTKATAQLSILENKIKVSIPQIYITKHLVNEEIRVDIYTTKGNISINLGNYSEENSKYQWRDLDSDNKNIYSAPLGKIANVGMYSTSIITGGRNGDNFSEIRDRVVKSRTKKSIPIRNNELEVYLEERGYSLIRSIDTITERKFIATKKLPTYDDGGMHIQGTILEILTNEGELNRSKINYHGSCYTLLPNLFFKQIDNKIFLMTESEENELLNLETTQLLIFLEENNIFYTPFHYTINYTNGMLRLRPYNLSTPTLLSRQKLAENTSNGYRIISDKINLVYFDDKYVLKVSTISNDLIKDLPVEEIICQLSFIPANDVNSVFINGNMIGTSGKELVFSFDLETMYDINADNDLALKGFSRNINDNFDYRINLDAVFNIVFIVDSNEYIENRNEDSLNNSYIGYHLVSKNATAITVERLTMTLGEPLEYLLSDSRMSVSGYEYEVYEADIPLLYKSNVYKRDDNGFIVLEEDPNTGKKYPVVLHYAGDPILDEDGEPKLEYKKGDIKLINGEPIVTVDRGRLFFLNLLLLNSVYYFATVPEQKEWFNNIPKLISDFFKNDLSDINDIVLERTKVYYVPKSTIGKINIEKVKGRIEEVDSEQDIIVVFYVDTPTNRNIRLRGNFEQITKQEIVSWLNNNIVSISELTTTLTEKLGEGVHGIKIIWSGDLEDVDSFIVIDPSESISVKQKLVQNYDQTLEIKDSISFSYIEQGI